ncbi:hypothetical protein SAMN02745121_02445 [Nannocystis exedens]|uniref:Uncharacterized protein n=1 Tax=Nannocystis exedens TaxID=54 RepID=A0A1I1WK69_9BACT|nr:hypothetical protein [Nannocystis exedens]PCC67809.1 hypothetical protein NAEX_00817 [Nannocystis exedens]SFD95557.1 hypothetical protein SAMN02745121_02445 [Nannocystis exedens]
MRASLALAAGVAFSLAPAGAAARTAPPEEREMVRPDHEGEPSPPMVPPPLVAITPPDLVPPVIPEKQWQAQRRKLKIQAAVSWTVAIVGLVGTAVPLVMLGTCGDAHQGSYVRDCPNRRGALIAAPIFTAVAVAGLVPAAIFTDRLLHQRLPERAPQVGVGPGGLLLRF